jgi:hypothetical protein
MKKVLAKRRQYYKVINPKGHNGLKYKLGINTDPNSRPLQKVGSCEMGAIYFTDAEHLSGFRNYGTLIAWVEPVSRIKPDEGNKWKAHTINITKMLPIKDALPLIYGKKPAELVKSYESFDIEVPNDLMQKLSLKEQYARCCSTDWKKFVRRNENNPKFVRFLKAQYRKSGLKFNDGYSALEFLVKSGLKLDEIDIYDLTFALRRSASFRALVKSKVSAEAFKIIFKLADAV